MKNFSFGTGTYLEDHGSIALIQSPNIMREERKLISSDIKRAAIELWKAKIPVRPIVDQLQINLRSIVKFATNQNKI
jgi:hypothetical protein